MKNIGINDIAERLEISRNTVSKVINNRGYVAEETRQKIIEMAVTLGYKKIQPEWLVKDKPKNILVIATAPDFSNYWGEIINGITNKLEEEAYNCFYHFLTFNQVGDFSVPTILTEDNISGIIVMNVYETKAIKVIQKLNIPTVYFDIPLEYNYENLDGDTILVEGRRSIAKITQNLIKKGMTKIGFVGDITYCKSIYERWCGFEKIMRQEGLEIKEEYCLTHSPKGHFYLADEVEEHIERLFEQNIPMPEAFVCANDVIAYRVINKLAKKDYHVPRDVRVSGFDDIEENAIQEKLLTTVKVKTKDIGIRLAEQMIWRIGHKDRQYELIKIIGEVVERVSTK